MIRLPIRGGNWNNGASTGVFELNLNNTRSNTNNNIGARPALEMCQKLLTYRVDGQCLFQKDAYSSVICRKIKQVGRSSNQRDRSAPPP